MALFSVYGTAGTATWAVLLFSSASVLLSLVITAGTVVLAVLGFILYKGVMLAVLGFSLASVLLGLVLTVWLFVLGFSSVLILALGGLVS